MRGPGYGGPGSVHKFTVAPHPRVPRCHYQTPYRYMCPCFFLRALLVARVLRASAKVSFEVNPRLHPFSPEKSRRHRHGRRHALKFKRRMRSNPVNNAAQAFLGRRHALKSKRKRVARGLGGGVFGLCRLRQNFFTPLTDVLRSLPRIPPVKIDANIWMNLHAKAQMASGPSCESSPNSLLTCAAICKYVGRFKRHPRSDVATQRS